MSQLRFLNSAKRKLSEKAQAALDDNPPRKWKIDTESSGISEAKKIRNSTLTSKTGKVCTAQGDHGNVTPSTTGTEARTLSTTTKVASHKVTMHTEEDEESLHRDSEVVSIGTKAPPQVGSEDELESLMKEWTTPVYAFFHPQPTAVKVDGQQAYEFKCAAQGCKVKVRRYTDTKDAQSTSNLRKHVRVCKGWGNDILKAADLAKNTNEVKAKLIGQFLRDGTIMAVFERSGKGKITYSNCQDTREETQYVFVVLMSRMTCADTLLVQK